MLSPHGHVEQHACVTEDGTTAWLDTEPGAGAALLKYLEMMRFFTAVEPRDASGEIARAVAGRAAVRPIVFPRARRAAAAEVPGPKFAAGTVPSEPTSRYAARAVRRVAWPGGFRSASTCWCRGRPRRP